MVVGNRHTTHADRAFRPFHSFGNRLVRFLINRLFRTNLTDIMSGLRVMSRAFVENMSVLSSGFEVETEITINALKYGSVIREVDIAYGERPAGSFSKLHTLRDGARVLKTIFVIFKDYKPFLFFTTASLVVLVVSLAAGTVVIREYLQTRLVGRLPLAVFASGSMIFSMILLVTGLLLDSINRRFDELHHLINKRR